jgi:excisionase family DNA binding protein
MAQEVRARLERIRSVRQIAEKLLVAESTLYEWCETGYIPHIRVGRLIRFDEGAIEKWLEQRACPSRQRRRIEVEISE